MINLKIARVLKINVEFTADQWQLYDPKGSEARVVAKWLNSKLEHCVNLGYDRDETAGHVRSLMRQYSEYGANDSAPHHFLAVVLEEIYGI